MGINTPLYHLNSYTKTQVPSIGVMNSMVIGGENRGNASLDMLAELAVKLGNNIFDDDKVEEIMNKKKKYEEKQDKIKKPTNILVVINMKKGVSLKFKDYHPAPAIAT
ncbi:hypothetical protein POM88_029021 [Heracleum sosnowskyi]|uniref:Uncharacterized protein n=1 Tax=Heracleum sosnowskyi TaxID=360622 RepID=A0AAD8MI45_9APIA|nr:hypothetical protein POM88_029021 [Heracleum sosnowskyi]